VVDVGVLMTMLGKIFLEGVWQVSLGGPGGVKVVKDDDGG